MSDIQEGTATNVVEVETETKEVAVVDPKIKALEEDNFKQREEIRKYKAELDELSKKFTDLNTTLETQKEEEAKAAKDRELSTALTEAGITEDKAKELALKVLGDSSDIKEGITKLLEEYPFLADKKKITLPDTGKSIVNDEAIPVEQKLKSGISRLINGDK